MSLLEQILHATNADYININGDRQIFTNHYNVLRNSIYKTLQEEQPLGKWLCGHKLGGSYADNLKITKPDEFDLVIHLVFPENDRIIVKKDPRRPGNVTLDMTEVLNALEKQEHNQLSYTYLKKLVTNRNLLLEDKMQNMIQGAVTRALNKMGKKIEVNGRVTPIVYRRCGPAHTMFINDRDIKYSVDFVPAIRLIARQNILEPEQLRFFKDIRYWDAIPKPLKPFEANNVSFRASYYDAENVMIKGKQKLKETIKFMKKFRDSKQNMNNLKSYYIKTLFLWQIKAKSDAYWSTKTLKDILIDMCRELKTSLATSGRNGKLLFFWDPKLDLFAAFTQRQRDDMFNCVVAHIYTLERADGNLTADIDRNVRSSFSTRAERLSQDEQRNGRQTGAAPNQQSAPKNQSAPKQQPAPKNQTAPRQQPAQRQPPAPSQQSPAEFSSCCIA
ncbi:uncharacterized protein Dvir_GJ20118, isoform C [Drosophila virilis]|uniref:Uncharacterized protein, isoform A n=1 Tax=Drosophila virilis TaxID=7244 RepID=B4LKQ8_DROVI|nr:uncharacterized protein Dvir_GJ20118, isoform A [Drosophila virilis]KRF80236.1 uncharacterized protein Dvir_GJ20118, isoform B [Drosophila virilis]KRF80237.1 uncharacterized protein Dvir_GJ20118, isoform C [Drosophila virilis]